MQSPVRESLVGGQGSGNQGRRLLPPWLKVQPPATDQLPIFYGSRRAVDDNQLHTVCEEARCPSLNDCWAAGDATFMVGGKTCTRGCRFCSVETLRTPPSLELDEPVRLAAAVERMGLSHVVITVVNRDDLPDGGAGHFRRCVDAVNQRCPETTIELLCSDLEGDESALHLLLDGAPLAVFAHNVECVRRLDSLVRDPRASFDQSLAILRAAKAYRPKLLTKSSLMLGLGESDEDVLHALQELRDAKVDLVTLGQYLPPGRPGERFLPVDRYVSPQQFDEWADVARKLGFKAAVAGPLVRSSYQAGRLLAEASPSLES